MVGYLLGAPKTSPLWGPNMWVEQAGHAVLEAEVLRDLYAVAAGRWVEDGRTAHYALVPDDPELIDAWFRLGFGSQHAHALRPVPVEPLPARSGLTIRHPERTDIPVLAELELALPQHLGLAPVFSAGKLVSLDEAVAEWEESFDDPGYTTFVAEYNGQVIGSAVGCALTRSSAHVGLNRADNAAFLGFAAVRPDARGLGAGRALGEAVLTWSAEAGYTSIGTDWRVTNLLASRTWPRLGFVQTFHRLHRLVGY